MDLVTPGQTVGEAARTLTGAFTRAGLDSPEADARVLLCHVLGLSSADLARARATGSLLDDDAAGPLNALSARRVERVPLQHLTGTAPFRYLDLQVGPGCLIPRPETELLVDQVLAFLDRTASARAGSDGCGRPADVLDLGTGSGALAASVAHERPGTRVTGVDLSSEALAWAEKNTVGLGVALVQADGTESRREFERAFDAIICNPPYVPESERPIQAEALADPGMALFGGSEDGLAIPLAMLERASEWLRPGGFLAMEHAELQGEPLREAFFAAGFGAVATLQDYTQRDRMTVGTLADTPEKK